MGTRLDGRPRVSAARTNRSAAGLRPAALAALAALAAGSAVLGSCVSDGAGTARAAPAEAGTEAAAPASPSVSPGPTDQPVAPQAPLPATARLQLREASDLRPGYGPVTAQAWRRDGETLLTADFDRVQLWDAPGARNLGAMTESGGLIVDFSLFEAASGKARLAVASRDGTVAVWDPDDGARLASVPLDADSLAWSPDGSALAVCLSDGRTLALAWPGLKVTAELAAGPGEAPLRAAWLRSGKELVLGGASGALVLWKPGEPAARTLGSASAAGTGPAGVSPAVRALAVSPDGIRAAAARADGSVVVLDIASGTVLVRFPAHRGAALSVAWSPDGFRLATGGEDKQVRVWEAADGAPQAMQHHNSLPVRSVAWRPGGRYLSSGAGSMDLRAHTGATILWEVP